MLPFGAGLLFWGELFAGVLLTWIAIGFGPVDWRIGSAAKPNSFEKKNTLNQTQNLNFFTCHNCFYFFQSSKIHVDRKKKISTQLNIFLYFHLRWILHFSPIQKKWRETDEQLIEHLSFKFEEVESTLPKSFCSKTFVLIKNKIWDTLNQRWINDVFENFLFCFFFKAKFFTQNQTNPRLSSGDEVKVVVAVVA